MISDTYTYTQWSWTYARILWTSRLCLQHFTAASWNPQIFPSVMVGRVLPYPMWVSWLVFHGNAGIFKKGFQMTCGSFMIQLDPQQRLVNVLIFSSPNCWGYWGYNLQQMLERDVQNPQNETCCHLDCLFTPSARWLAVRCPTCRLGEHLQNCFLDDNYYIYI